MRGFARSLIGIIILALIGGYYYFYEVRYRGEKLKEKEKSRKIYPLEKANICKIIYQHDGKKIILEKNGADWLIKSPISAKADNKEVGTFVDTLSGIKVFRTLQDAKCDDPEFGLKKNPVIITFVNKKGIWARVTFGKVNPTDSYFYTRRGKDQKVLLTWIYPKKLLQKSLYDFRVKKVLSIPSSDVTEIRIYRKGTTINLRKTGVHTWKLEAPIKAKGDRYTIEGFISSLVGEKVVQFLDTPPKDPKIFGFEKPRLKISLTIKSNTAKKPGTPSSGKNTMEKIITLLAGKDRDAGHLYVKVTGSPSVMIVKKSFFKNADKKLFDLRDKNVWDFDTDTITHIKFTRTSRKKLTIEAKKNNKEGTWHLLKPSKMNADNRAVGNWLWDLSGLRVREFLDQAEFDALAHDATPDVTFSLDAKGHKKPIVLTLYNTNGKWVAQAEDPAWYYVVDTDAVTKTFKSVFDLKYRRLVTLKEEAVAKIEIITGKNHQIYKKKKNTWYKKMPGEDQKIPNINILNLIWELGNLKYIKRLKEMAGKNTQGITRLIISDKMSSPIVAISFYKSKDSQMYTFTVKGKQGAFAFTRESAGKFLSACKKLTAQTQKP